MIAALLAALLSCAAAAEEGHPLPEPPPGARVVSYSADRVDFDTTTALLHLSGDVLLRESTWTVKGQELWIDTERQTGRSAGPLLIEDGVSAVYGESGQFDFLRHTGRLFGTRGGQGSWSIQAREAELSADHSLDYRDADFTSCDYHPPHYHFHASHISVKPHERLVARNALFYLGNVPSLYLPVLYKPLGPSHWLGTKSQPGYDRRHGWFLKNTLTTQYSPAAYSKLFADYYQKDGLGLGGEAYRRAGTDSRGGLLFYNIRESSTGQDRWAVIGDGYQALGSSTAFQGRLQTMSDPSFNNDYQRSSTFRLTPELDNAAAFVHRFSQATARLSFARTDAANAAGDGFYRTRQSAPRLDVQSAPLGLWGLPWLNTLSGFADRADVYPDSKVETSAGGTWEGTRSFALVRGLSWTPTADLSETYYNHVDSFTIPESTGDFNDAFVGRWGVANDLRWNTALGEWDLAHAYARRLKPDSAAGDAGALDKGVEKNLVALSDVFLPSPDVWARVSSGYDLRTFRDRTVGFRGRVQPITAQGSWSAGSADVSARDDYALDSGNRAVILDARWGDDPRGKGLGGGLAWNRSEPGRYVVSGDFAIAPSSPTWRVALTLRLSADTSGGVGRLHGPRLFEKEFVWTRRWHDFYTKLAARLRPGGVGEFSVRAELKFGPTDPRQAPHRDWESEWFPERARGGDLRP